MKVQVGDLMIPKPGYYTEVFVITAVRDNRVVSLKCLADGMDLGYEYDLKYLSMGRVFIPSDNYLVKLLI